MLGALGRCCRHNPPHHWDIHPWQNSFQKLSVAKLPWGPTGEDAETGFFSKPTQKRGLQMRGAALKQRKQLVPQSTQKPKPCCSQSGDSAESGHSLCQVRSGLYLTQWLEHPASFCHPAALLLSTVLCHTRGRFGSIWEPALPVCSCCFTLGENPRHPMPVCKPPSGQWGTQPLFPPAGTVPNSTPGPVTQRHPEGAQT